MENFHIFFSFRTNAISLELKIILLIYANYLLNGTHRSEQHALTARESHRRDADDRVDHGVELRPRRHLRNQIAVEHSAGRRLRESQLEPDPRVERHVGEPLALVLQKPRVHAARREVLRMPERRVARRERYDVAELKTERS